MGVYVGSAFVYAFTERKSNGPEAGSCKGEDVPEIQNRLHIYFTFYVRGTFGVVFSVRVMSTQSISMPTLLALNMGGCQPVNGWRFLHNGNVRPLSLEPVLLRGSHEPVVLPCRVTQKVGHARALLIVVICGRPQAIL